MDINKNKIINCIFFTGFAALIILGCDQENENQLIIIKDSKAVEKSINDIFGWAVNKDFALFFNTISDDTNFISVTPYARVKFGIDAVKKDSSFWGSPDFKAIRHEIRDLRINFSKEGSVVWFYCELDDINTWKGEPANWENVRWTGVLEKRNGKWRVVQQHFSWAKEN